MTATSNGSKRQINVSLQKIKPSPENDELYGAIKHDDELVDLANNIIKQGVLEPLIVTKDNWIVSGHRRYAAAKLAGISEVPIRRLTSKRSDCSAHDYKRLLRQYNHQRHKTPAQRLNEKLVDLDPNVAYQQLIQGRLERSTNSSTEIAIRGSKVRKAISNAKLPMVHAVLAVADRLRKYWPLTVRQVHYQLLNIPPLRHSRKPGSVYINDRKSYNDLVDLVTRLRLNGEVPFAAISDETRPTTNTQFYRDAANFVDNEIYNLFRGYRRDLMQSQVDHFEMVLEKLTAQNIVQPVANELCLPMTVGRGYCSLEPRRAIVQRFNESAKDRLVLLIASDFDPDGEEICESFGRSIRDDFGVEADRLCLHKILLTHDQVRQWNLPSNGMEAKMTSPNYAKFAQRFGDDVFELEAIDPPKMQTAIRDAVRSVIDVDAFNREVEIEKSEAVRLQATKSVVIDAIGEKSLMPDFSENEGIE